MKPVPPLMSYIPEDRLFIDKKSFTSTGCHMKLSKSPSSNQVTAKRYVALFTCLTKREVHLEKAGDLSTDAFILALRRFISRGGKVSIIRSDNGTNVVGASKELRQPIANINQSSVNRHLAVKGTKWKFNPPVSPWMGSIWKTLVKPIKCSVKVIIRDILFTEECLSIFLCEVE